MQVKRRNRYRKLQVEEFAQNSTSELERSQETRERKAPAVMDNNRNSRMILDDTRVEPTWKFWRRRVLTKKWEETQAQAEQSIPARSITLVCFNCLKGVPHGKPITMFSSVTGNSTNVNLIPPTRETSKKIESPSESIHPQTHIFTKKFNQLPSLKLALSLVI